MILTEDKAKENWCPSGARNKWGNDGKCIASKCMAWRWKDDTCAANGENWKGYCGLAGRPEPMDKEG